MHQLTAIQVPYDDSPHVAGSAQASKLFLWKDTCEGENTSLRYSFSLLVVAG